MAIRRPDFDQYRSIQDSVALLGDLVDRLQVMVRTHLWAQILFGMLLGVTTGLVLSPTGGGWLEAAEAETVAGWLAVPGRLFLALIQMVVVPLVISSIMLGINSSSDPAYLKRIGLRIFPYFVGTTMVAVGIGMAAAFWIRPGDYIDQGLVQAALAEDVPAVSDGSGVPGENSGVRSAESGGEGTREESVTESSRDIAIPDLIIDLVPVDPLQAILTRSMLELVIFAILMGVALLSIPESRARPLTDLLSAVQEISMKVVSWAMMLAPYAVFGLLAQITVLIGFDALLGMSVYVGTVLAGLAVLLFVYTHVVWFTSGLKPWSFLARIREVLLLAFSTSSSAAVMPLSIQTAEERLNVRESVSQFVVPLGATINMDGTALYQVVAAVFLTQVFGIDLTIPALLLLAATTIGASIGAPSTPGVGIVVLATILADLGVPAAGIALIIGVDRILDMARTSVNVAGDLTACVVMNRWLPGDSVAESQG
ncbi:MAG: dicarboxylate/amino acid:cation symporter [bacterium]|nr:dicarboxylate/amino acid:cation symporter [bacterium]